jgi:hypothetical protein
MSHSNYNNASQVVLPIGTQAASIELPGIYVQKKSIIKSVALINQAALAADNTNFLTIQLLDAPSGNVLAEIDTKAANEGALSKNVAKVAPETDIAVAAGSSLAINVVKNGTGVPTLASLHLNLFAL